jgi:hypothetical protein
MGELAVPGPYQKGLDQKRRTGGIIAAEPAIVAPTRTMRPASNDPVCDQRADRDQRGRADNVSDAVEDADPGCDGARRNDLERSVSGFPERAELRGDNVGVGRMPGQDADVARMRSCRRRSRSRSRRHNKAPLIRSTINAASSGGNSFAATSPASRGSALSPDRTERWTC